MDLNTIKASARDVASLGGNVMTIAPSTVLALVELILRQEKELFGARFAAECHLRTLESMRALLKGDGNA